MSWAYLAFCAAFALLAANAWRPSRREPFSMMSFALGWLPSELPLHMAAAVVGGTALFFSTTGSIGWAAWVGLAVAAVSVAGYLGLAREAHGAGALVAKALEEVTGGRADGPLLELAPRWTRWWRLVLVVPFPLRGIRRQRTVDYWGDGNYRHTLDILSSRTTPPTGAPVLVYVHGGAWILGDKRQQGIPMMHELVSRGWVCVSINYRLSPRATWPAQIVDCKRAVAWVRQHIGGYGGDPGFIALSGGSAGGHLCTLVALTSGAAEWQPGFEEADTRVDACVPFYGVYDATAAPDGGGAYGRGLGALLERRVMKVTREIDPGLFEAASPDRRVTPAAPPMFVVHGLNDTVVPPQVARTFVERLRAVSLAPVAFVELPRTQHAFDLLASIRTRHTTMGVVRFLDWARLRSTAEREAEPDAQAESGRPLGGIAP